MEWYLAVWFLISGDTVSESPGCLSHQIPLCRWQEENQAKRIKRGLGASQWYWQWISRWYGTQRLARFGVTHSDSYVAGNFQCPGSVSQVSVYGGYKVLFWGQCQHILAILRSQNTDSRYFWDTIWELVEGCQSVKHSYRNAWMRRLFYRCDHGARPICRRGEMVTPTMFGNSLSGWT